MLLNKSWINQSLLKNILKRNLFPIKISLVLVVGFGLLSFTSQIAYICMLFVFAGSAIVLTTMYAGLIQTYRTKKLEGSFMASLPIEKHTLWFTHYLAGFILVLGTLVIEAFMVMLIALLFREGFFPYHGYFRVIVTTIRLGTLYYTLSFLASCVTGNRLGQWVLTLSLYAVPVVLFIGSFGVGSIVVYESLDIISYIDKYIHLLASIFPLVSGMQYIANMQWDFGLFHILIGVISFVGSYYLYVRYPIENSQEMIVYPKTYLFIKASIIGAMTTFVFICVMHLNSIMKDYGTTEKIKAFGIFILIGVIVTVIAEIIFKNKKYFKSLLIYLPILALIFGASYGIGQYNRLQAYQDFTDKVSDSEEFLLSINNVHVGDEDYYYFSQLMDSNLINKIITYFKEHPEEVVPPSSTEQHVRINIQRTDFTGEISYDEWTFEEYAVIDQIQWLTINAKEEAFYQCIENIQDELVEYVVKTNITYLEEYLKNYDFIGIDSSNAMTQGILDRQQMEAIIEEWKKPNSITYKNLLSTDIYAYDSSKASVYINQNGTTGYYNDMNMLVNDAIIEIINSPEALARAELLNLLSISSTWYDFLEEENYSSVGISGSILEYADGGNYYQSYQAKNIVHIDETTIILKQQFLLTIEENKYDNQKIIFQEGNYAITAELTFKVEHNQSELIEYKEVEHRSLKGEYDD